MGDTPDHRWTEDDLERESATLSGKWLAEQDREVIRRLAGIGSPVVSLSLAGMVMAEVCRASRSRAVDLLNAVINPLVRSAGGVPYGEQYVDITIRHARAKPGDFSRGTE